MKIFLFLSLLLLLVSVSFATDVNEMNLTSDSHETTQNNVNVRNVYNEDNFDNENENFLDKSYDSSQKVDIKKDDVYNSSETNQKIKSSPSNHLNIFSQNVPNDESVWHIDVNHNNLYASNMSYFNVSITDGSGKTLNKGSLNYYLNDELIGKSIVKNNKSHLDYLIPENYDGIHSFKIVYIDENNKITNHSYENNYFIIYSKDTLLLDSVLPSTYPYDINNTIEVYLRDIKGNIVPKSGNLEVILTVQVYDPDSLTKDIKIPIGTYDFINGSSSFNLFINSSSDWVIDFTYDMSLYLHFHDINENKDYYLSNYRHYMQIMDLMNIGLGKPVIDESKKTVRFIYNGLYNYEDSILLVYINDEYMTSLDFREGEVLTYDYRIPDNFLGEINMSAKRVTNTGFNTSYIYETSVNIMKHAKIDGINVSGYAGQTITFKGNVNDEKNNPIKSGRIVVKLNGKTIKSDIYLNGSNSFSYKYKIPEKYSTKDYKITYVYVENDVYARDEDEKTLTVTVKPTKIVADNVSAYAGQTVTITGTISDINNNIIKSGRVVLKLNGKTINSNIILNNSNQFTYKYKVPAYTAKDYILTYVYVGDKIYQRSELNKTFTIKNQESKITANNIIDYQGKTVTITVKITGAKTGINAVKGTVGFKINGKTVKIDDKPFIQNITNGTVVFKYNIPSTMKADQYQIMVTYSGGRFLLGAKTNTSTLTVKDHTTKIMVKIPKSKSGQTVRLLAAINDSYGKIKSGNTTFKLNDKVIGYSKISAGAAVLNYTIPKNYLGNYILEVIAQGTYTDLNSTKTTLKVVN